MKKLKLNTETLRVLTEAAASPEGRRGTVQGWESSRMGTVCECTLPITN